MLENFIANHKKLVVFLSVLVVVGLVFFIGYSTTRSFTATTDPDAQTGDDDTEGGNLLLPYTNPIYTIAQNPSKIAGVPDDHSLLITAPEGYRTAAAKSIYDLGFDPTNYKITFDYESPFKPYE